MCTCMVVKRGNLSENQTIILHVITAQGGGGGGGSLSHKLAQISLKGARSCQNFLKSCSNVAPYDSHFCKVTTTFC